MKIHTNTEHKLQSNHDSGQNWKDIVAGMFNPAQQLVKHGQLTEALQTAKTRHRDHYGYADSLQIEFRIQSVIITTISEYEWLK